MDMQLLKRFALATGLYAPARLIHRNLSATRRANFHNGMAFYRQFVRCGQLCFDIGANIGEKSEMMLALGATVISVEPQPELAREISARGAPYGKNSIVVNMAIGSASGFATMHLRKESALSSLLEDWQGPTVAKIKVPVTTLDAMIEDYGMPDFVKIDVEGYEVEVLQGLSRHVPCLTIEYHCDDRCIALTRQAIGLLKDWPIRINAIGSEKYSYLMDWKTPQQFLSQFPACVGSEFYGDLIVKTI